MIRRFIYILIIGFIGVSTSYAEVSGSAGADFVSKYVWRGFNLSDGANTQPFVELSINDVTFGYWGSFNWEAEDTNLEQDLYIGYDFSVLDEELDISVGYTYYKFPSAGEAESSEIWLGFTLAKTLLSPSLTFYFDIGDEEDGGGDGEYISLGFSHDIEIGQDLSLGLSLSINYNNELFINEKGFADVVPKLSFSYQASEFISLGLSAGYSSVIDSDVESAMGSDDEFFAVFSISLS